MILTSSFHKYLWSVIPHTVSYYSYPTFTKFCFAEFPAWPSPCLFFLIYNLIVAIVLIFTTREVSIHSLICTAHRIEYHPLVCTDLHLLREHMEIMLTYFIPATLLTLSIQFCIV